MNRTEFLKKGALISAGVTALVIGGPALKVKEALGDNSNGTKTSWPWPYPTAGLTAATARIRAHDAYWSGKGCSYAVFEGIIAGLRDTIGNDYNNLPTEIMIYGHSGGGGWGATCGTINGAAAAISLVCAKAVSDPMVKELYGWFTQADFPSTDANSIAVANGYGTNTYNMNLPQSINASPLCHVAVSRWCNAANYSVGANERKERCARMCGDVAYKAVELLNQQFSTGSFTTVYVAPTLNATCLSCHGSAGMEHDVASNMECASCHGTDVYPHTNGVKENAKVSFEINQNYPNPFTDDTKIEFNLMNSETVSMDIYNLNGQKITSLCSNKMYSPGKHEIQWNGRNHFGDKVDAGMYIIHFITADGIKTINLMKL